MYALSDAGYGLWGIVVVQVVTLVGLYWQRQRSKSDTQDVKQEVHKATSAVTEVTPTTGDVELVRSDIKMLSESVRAAQKSDAMWRDLVNLRLDRVDEHINRLYVITGARKAVEFRNKERNGN